MNTKKKNNKEDEEAAEKIRVLIFAKPHLTTRYRVGVLQS